MFGEEFARDFFGMPRRESVTPDFVNHDWGYLPQWAKDKVLELTKGWHPYMNVQPVINMVMEADKRGFEIVRKQPLNTPDQHGPGARDE